MQHLSAADLELTVVTLSETCTSHRSYPRFATDFLLRPARRKLSRIITAAELLSSYSSNAVDVDVVGLARAIASEAHRLDDLISKQLALVDEISAESIRGGLARPIALAAERVSSLLEHPCEVDICDNCPDDANADQANSDYDWPGDACDDDDDGVDDASDNCPLIHNPDQKNDDDDALGGDADAPGVATARRGAGLPRHLSGHAAAGRRREARHRPQRPVHRSG